MNPITLFLVIAGALVGLALGKTVDIFLAPPFLVAAVIIALSLKMANAWQKFVILRAGKLQGVKGPGLFMIFPVIDNVTAVIDERIQTTAFNAEQASETTQAERSGSIAYPITCARSTGRCNFRAGMKFTKHRCYRPDRRIPITSVAVSIVAGSVEERCPAIRRVDRCVVAGSSVGRFVVAISGAVVSVVIVWDASRHTHHQSNDYRQVFEHRRLRSAKVTCRIELPTPSPEGIFRQIRN
jgi:hypothetical protein